jgi:hypothetical protein
MRCRLQFIQGQDRNHVPPIGRIGRRPRCATERRIEKYVGQTIVAGIRERCRRREFCQVGRGILCQSSVGVTR